jgi:hypothetical protein
VEDFRSTVLDEDALYAEVEAIDWAQGLTERTGLPLKTRWPIYEPNREKPIAEEKVPIYGS